MPAVSSPKLDIFSLCISWVLVVFNPVMCFPLFLFVALTKHGFFSFAGYCDIEEWQLLKVRQDHQSIN